jgi:hypothetical protein
VASLYTRAPLAMEEETLEITIVPARHPFASLAKAPGIYSREGGSSRPHAVNPFFAGLSMFNLAIDSKLRGCDVVRLKVEPAWHDRRSRHGPRGGDRTSRSIGIERAVITP